MATEPSFEQLHDGTESGEPYAPTTAPYDGRWPSYPPEEPKWTGIQWPTTVQKLEAELTSREAARSERQERRSEMRANEGLVDTAHSFATPFFDVIRRFRIPLGVLGAVLAYIPIGRATGYYPQIGVVSRKVGSGSTYSFPVDADASLRVYKGRIEPYAEAASMRSHSELHCTTTVDSKGNASTSCSTTTVQDATVFDIQDLQLSDGDGNIIESGVGSRMGLRLSEGANLPSVACPPAGKTMTAQATVIYQPNVFSNASRTTVTQATWTSDGECAAVKGIRFNHEPPDFFVPEQPVIEPPKLPHSRSSAAPMPMGLT